jgi:hypothetical protein
MSLSMFFEDKAIEEKWISFCKKFLENEQIDWNDISNEEQKIFTESWIIPNMTDSDDIWASNAKSIVNSFISKKISLEFCSNDFDFEETPRNTPVNIPKKLYEQFIEQVQKMNITISSEGDILNNDDIFEKFPGLRIGTNMKDSSSSMLITYVLPNRNCSWEKKNEIIPTSYIDIEFNETVAIIELTSLLHLLIYDRRCKKITFFYNDDNIVFRFYIENIEQSSFEENLLFVFSEDNSEETISMWDLDFDNIQIPEYTIKMFVPWKPIMVQYETISRISKETSFDSIEKAIEDKYSLYRSEKYRNEICKWDWNNPEANMRNIQQWVHDEKSMCVFSISNSNNINYRQDQKVFFVMINIRAPRDSNQPLMSEIPKIISVYKKYPSRFQAIEIVVNDSSFKLEVRFFIKIERLDRMKSNMKDIMDIIDEAGIVFEKPISKSNIGRMTEEKWKNINARLAPKLCNPQCSSDDWISNQINGGISQQSHSNYSNHSNSSNSSNRRFVDSDGFQSVRKGKGKGNVSY